MDFLTGAAPKMVFAFWLGVVVVAMTLVMFCIILAMRKLMLRKERIHRQAVASEAFKKATLFLDYPDTLSR